MKPTAIQLELEREALWASRALSHISSQNPDAVTEALLDLLHQLNEQEVQHRAEHPAAQLLVALLAEQAGLQFHWPSAAERSCRSAISRYRAAATCIELNATTTPASQ